MMNKEFIPYEEALALKELGFKEDCLGFWSKVHGLYITKTTGESKLFEGAGECKAPLYQQAFRWFREQSEFNDETISRCSKHKYSATIWNGRGNIEVIHDVTEQEAQDACLRKLIEIINQNKEDESNN